jgi:hypothetical protein
MATGIGSAENFVVRPLRIVKNKLVELKHLSRWLAAAIPGKRTPRSDLQSPPCTQCGMTSMIDSEIGSI